MNALTGMPDAGLEIAFVHSFFDAGGSQMAIERLHGAMLARGAASRLFYLYGPAGSAPTMPETAILVPGGGPGLRTALTAALRLWRCLRQRRPDALISFLPLGNAAGQAVAWSLGITHRIASHRVVADEFKPLPRMADMAAGSLGLYSRTVAVSRAVADSFARYPASYRRRFTVIHNGIAWRPSVLTKAEARASFGLPDSGPVAAAAGRLHFQKNYPLLLEALAAAPDLRLAIAGDGDDRAALDALASRLGVTGRVHFLGHIAASRVPDLLRAADLFVQPSRYEGQSNALLEAMQEGLPCLVSDVPAQTETVRDAAGADAALVLPPGDAAAWGAAMQAVAASPALAASLGTRARARAQAFSYERMVEAFAALARGQERVNS